MYVLLVQIDILPEHRDAFLAAMRGHAERARENESGTIRFDVITDENEPNRAFFYEVYTDKAAFEVHGKSESIAIFREETKGWSAGTVIVGRGETTYPPNGDSYWQK